MSTSTAYAATTNLIAAIESQSAAKSQDNFVFGIMRGEPIDNWAVDDGIYIAKVDRTIARNEMSGNSVGALREDYVIVVEIAVFRGGDTVNAGDTTSAHELRCWNLINAVESAIRADRTLGGAVPDAWPETSTMISEWDPENMGRRARSTVNVHCWAFI